MSTGLSNDPESPTALAAALAKYSIAVEPDQLALLDRYRTALWAWNEQLNLTRHTTLEKFADRDVLDSWELAKLIPRGRRVLDVGSGGGVPGLVIAICRPDLRVAVCESTQKKARVLEAIVRELSLPVEVFGCRAEELLQLRTFDALVARAVAPLAKLLTWLKPHWSSFEELLLIKGRAWIDERADARRLGLLKTLDLRKAAVYEAPTDDSSAPMESVILRIRPRGAAVDSLRDDEDL